MVNCVCDVFTTSATAKTAIQAVDEAKMITVFTFRDKDTATDQILVIHKA